MPHVVTQACCGDASCVYACPVNCIHPTPDEPDFGIAEMLYIDPNTCVDCGACVTACPVGAITASHRLTDGQERFIEINASMYAGTASGAAGARIGLTEARFPVDPGRRLPLAPIGHPDALAVAGKVSVGIVGSGPSAMYAADDLLRYPQVSVTMYERLDRPFGLARFGVAPDHESTRTVMRLFDDIAGHPRLEIRLNTEVGRDLTLEDLRAQHTAVIWAGGAPTDRRLQVSGADARNVISATSFVGWYNDHPDFADLDVDLSSAEAVVIGTGNVALDVARILVRDPDDLAGTSIAARALAALRSSAVRRVTVVGRRGAEHAAFTLPELVGLIDGGIPVTIDAEDVPDPASATDPTARAKLELLGEIAARPTPTVPHIRFAFDRAPREIRAVDGRTVGMVTDRPDGTCEVLDAGLVLTSIGYRGRPVPGLPFDDAAGVVPHSAGRVIADSSTGDAMPGMYVTGWIKRGPSGFIGTNKSDSAETVRSLVDDLENGVLTPAEGSRRAIVSRLGRS
ncbi:4Fe-4S dicluster domain-containing protein [Gordonia oryzae]|uniref:4Fe-4S dicluster domain-containing protein n=1 Tax=Gordonia oryzae TaxID=2487349 RepID=A0A3N4GU73_9ACTN|nr:4Fe-4S binding protein [Gordonia oryzae]RPA65875.1 4Fe-4S dicluster domain-containing protein [Gordonia oryzae]